MLQSLHKSRLVVFILNKPSKAIGNFKWAGTDLKRGPGDYQRAFQVQLIVNHQKEIRVSTGNHWRLFSRNIPVLTILSIVDSYVDHLPRKQKQELNITAKFLYLFH